MFKTLREGAGLTTKFVATKLNIKVSTLYKIEQHISMPSAPILLEMKEIYKCTYEEIMSCYKLAKGEHDERKNKKSI